MVKPLIIFPLTIVVIVVIAPLTIQKIIDCIRNKNKYNENEYNENESNENESNEMRSIVI